MLVLFLLDLLFKGNIPLCKWLGLSFDRVFKSHVPETSHFPEGKLPYAGCFLSELTSQEHGTAAKPLCILITQPAQQGSRCDGR